MIEDFCTRYRVEMKGPSNVAAFLDEVNTMRQKRGKAANLLFADIDADLVDKERFLLK